MNVMLLIVMLTSVMTCVSCSKDDEPKADGTQTSNKLVGTWYFYDYEGMDYDDYFIFRSNGTGFFGLDEEDFIYEYDSKTNMLKLQFEGWDVERYYVEWLGNNKIDIDGYGTYVRK